MSLRSTIVAAALLASAANAHMTMQEPVIYSQDKALIDTAPLTPAQYPCHSQYGFEVTKMNPMKAGAPGVVKLKGSAIHGGGSCQLSVTTDVKPTKDSKFKVIKSFIGNCPSAGDAQLKYTLPASIPNGKATFAWTWMPILSGGPEFYMNCAPIEVSGGASDTTAFNALPDMLIANLGDMTTCRNTMGAPLAFPNPGADVEKGTAGPAAAPPTGDCGPKGGAAPAAPATPPTNGGGAPATPPADPAKPADPATPAKPADPAAPAKPSGAPAAPVTPPTTPDAPVTPPTTPVTPPAVPGAPVTPPTTPGAPVTPPTTPEAPVTPPTTPTTPGAPAAGGSTCSANGALKCNGALQFGLCNNGKIVWQPVAQGTTCVNDTIQKRSSFKRAAAPYNGRIVRKAITFTA